MQSITAKTENDKIVLPLDLLKEKKFVAFEYQSQWGVIPLLAYISTEGKIVTEVPDRKSVV